MMNAFRALVIFFGLLTRVLAYCPERCICLWYIDYTLKINCSRSEKTEVPYDINPQVKILDLSHNEITAYSHSKLLKAVEEIDLSNNQITQVSFGTSMKHLGSLDLSYNSITHLKKVDIRHLKHLKKVNLSFNSKLHEVSGLRSDSLEELDLSHCFISFVDEGFLDWVGSIRFIDLSFNSFTSLKNIRSRSLQVLDASHSEIDSLTHLDIFDLPELLRLNVSFNPNLKIDFKYENSCWSVQNLDLFNSSVTSLSDMFPFCSLQVLNASFNQIEVIEVRTFFNNCELSFVNLSNNKIAEIHERAFYTTEKLKVLDLSENQIQDVFFTLYLKQVHELDLSRNRIFSLSGLMLKNAVALDLSRNKITEIWMNLNEKTPKFKKLNLSYNKIKHLGKISSKSVNSIDLSHSFIASIDLNAFENAESLMTLNLAGNKLTILDHRTFVELSSLKDLVLTQNLWSCHCESNDFKELYQYLTVDSFLGKTQELICARTNESWKSTCQDNWRREREWRKTIYSLTVSMAIACVVVVAVFVCKLLSKKTNTPGESDSEAPERDENLPATHQNATNSSENLQVRQGQLAFPRRNSTPPPNYEAALLFPKLSEEAIQLTRSRETTASNDDEESGDSRQNDEVTSDPE